MMVASTARHLRNALAGIFIFCLGAAGGMVIHDANAAPTANIVFGGFGDPSGQGCTNGLIANGHIGHGEQVVLPGYPAHMEPWIDGGMAGSTAKGLPGGIDAANRLLREGKRVEIHGCSQGSDVVVAVSQAVPGLIPVTHGSPHHANGIFHSEILQNPAIEPFARDWGGLATDRIPVAGTHAFYNEGDLYGNYVPNQWDIGAVISMASDTLGGDGHWVQPLGREKCVFTDSFGVVNHVYDDGNPVTRNACP